MASSDRVPSDAVYHEDEDLDDDDEDDVDVDDDVDEDSASSSPVPGVAVPAAPAPSSSAAQVTIAVPGVPDLRHQQVPAVEAVPGVTKKPPLFQRLWTDEDEIELLQGFLEYTTQRGGGAGSNHHHHDTTAFYDQIKSKLQLDFNKNQLVEKLRRLKKKYRNVMNKFGSGKDYAFKSPHDQATFELSCKIWGAAGGIQGATVRGGPLDEAGFEEDDPNNPSPNTQNFIDHQSPNPNNPNGIDVNSRTPRPRKRNRAGAVKVEEKQHPLCFNSTGSNPQTLPIGIGVVPTPIATPVAVGSGTGSGSGSGLISNVIEETVRSCLSPIFKELLGNAINLNSNSSRGYGFALSPMPLGFGGGVMGAEMIADSKWRKQQILELEVFSKRLELVQDQIKAQLEDLRSMGG